MKLAMGCDHGGFDLKAPLLDYLRQKHPEVTVMDMGTNSRDSVDYPDFGLAVAKAVSGKKADRGILICGTGIGISIAANKVKGIRAALVYNELTAEMSRKHNDANILCLGARTTEPEMAKKILEIWLTTDFEGGRHQRRIDKINEL
jgi:ribose 5-phosphate isomerase B